MNKKNQANRLARECITTALIQLSQQKEFSSITVSELTARAGVSRMTYYRNYHSKEEVFRTYMDEIVENYCQNIYKNEKPENYGEYKYILHCFRYFEKYKTFISCLMNIGMSNLLLEALNTHLLTTYYEGRSDSPGLYYTLLAYAGALFNIYITWLTNGALESVEFLADIIYWQIHEIHSGMYGTPTDGRICTDYMPPE